MARKKKNSSDIVAVDENENIVKLQEKEPVSPMHL